MVNKYGEINKDYLDRIQTGVDRALDTGIIDRRFNIVTTTGYEIISAIFKNFS